MADTAMVIVFSSMLLCLLLGILARRKKDMDFEQWTVGGRGFGILFVFLLLAGEIYTTFTFLGGSGWAYGTGGPSAYILCYGTLAYILSYFILPRIWRFAKQHNLISQSDFFEVMFRSKALSVIVAIIGVVAIIPYLQTQITGLGVIMEVASYGRVSKVLAMAIAMVILALYVTISGIHGSAWTAVFKDFLVLIVVVAIGIALPAHVGGIGAMFHRINELKPGFLTLRGDKGVPWFISTVVLTGLGFYMWPHSFSAVYTAKNEGVFRRNATFLPIYNLILLFVFFAGFAAILIVPHLSDTNMALMEAVTKVFPNWLVGIVGAAGVLCALVPGSLLLISAATILAENIYRPLVHATNRQTVQFARIMVWLIALLTFYFSIHTNATIVALLLMGYNFVTQFFPSVLLALFARKHVTTAGAMASILVGVVLVTVFTLLNKSTLWGLNSGFIAFLINFLVVLIVSAMTRPSSAKRTTAIPM